MLGEEKALDGQGDFFQLDGFGARSRMLGRLRTEEKLLVRVGNGEERCLKRRGESSGAAGRTSLASSSSSSSLTFPTNARLWTGAG